MVAQYEIYRHPQFLIQPIPYVGNVIHVVQNGDLVVRIGAAVPLEVTPQEDHVYFVVL